MSGKMTKCNSYSGMDLNTKVVTNVDGWTKRWMNGDVDARIILGTKSNNWLWLKHMSYPKCLQIQSNCNGSNIFGTIENCSRQG